MEAKKGAIGRPDTQATTMGGKNRCQGELSMTEDV